jgi:hypothetical protein
MTGKYTREDHEQYRRERAKAEQAKAERMEKETTRRAWVADGGSAADFEKAWPQLRDQGRRQRTVDADRRAREAQVQSRTSRI